MILFSVVMLGFCAAVCLLHCFIEYCVYHVYLSLLWNNLLQQIVVMHDSIGHINIY